MFLLIWLARRLIVLAVVLAIPLVAGELLARKLIGDAVTSAVRARIGATPHISLGSSPVLLQLIRGRVDEATISATGARIDGLPPVTLTATLHDVHLANLTSLQGAIGSLALDVRLTPAQVRNLLATPGCIGALPSSLRATLTATPRVLLFPGRIDVLPPAGRAVEVRLRPIAAHTALSFAVSAVELHGAPAPAADVAQAQSQVSCERQLPQLPFGVALTGASARSGALELVFTGVDATFKALG